MNPNVLEWGVETKKITYYCPFKISNNHLKILPCKGKSNGFRSYFIDFEIKFLNADNEIEYALIETKSEQMFQPIKSKTIRSFNWLRLEKFKNTRKWESAVKYCEKMTKKTGFKWSFRVFTLKEIRDF